MKYKITRKIEYKGKIYDHGDTVDTKDINVSDMPYSASFERIDEPLRPMKIKKEDKKNGN